MSTLCYFCLFVGGLMSYLCYFCLFVGELMSTLCYLCLLVGGLMSTLRYLCLFVHHILCCVFALFVFVLCALCCQFLWIVFALFCFSLSCVPYVASFSGLFNFDCPSDVYFSTDIVYCCGIPILMYFKSMYCLPPINVAVT